ARSSSATPSPRPSSPRRTPTTTHATPTTWSQCASCVDCGTSLTSTDPPAVACGRHSGCGGPLPDTDAALTLTLVGMHAFEVGQHDISVQGMTMLDSRVLDDGVCDGLPVLSGELTSTARASLGVSHARRMAWIDHGVPSSGGGGKTLWIRGST